MAEAADDSSKLAKPLANLIINDVAAYANANGVSDMAQTALSPARVVELVKLLAEDTISSKQAKEVFAIVLEDDKDPSVVIEERGMKQVSDTGAIEAVVDGVLAAFPDKVEQYKAGKTGLLGFFVGQCMKQMEGPRQPEGYQPAACSETFVTKLYECDALPTCAHCSKRLALLGWALGDLAEKPASLQHFFDWGFREA